MKTKFNYKSKQKKLLYKLAKKSLNSKVELLPDLSSMYQEKVDKEYKFQKYENILRDELDIVRNIKFDGYLHMFYEISNFAKQLNISIHCFGNIQHSLTSYLLDIVDTYNMRSKKDFINFIPFEKKPTLYIVADSSRYYEIISFIEYKYSKQIHKIKNDSIKFQDNLKIKFIDLNIDKKTLLTEDDVKSLGLQYIKPNLNISQKQAIFIKVQNKKKKNAWLKKRKIKLLLGLESLNIGDVLVNKILTAREANNYKTFTSINDLKKRVPIIKQVDKKIQKKVFKNLQKSLKKRTKHNK